MFSEPYISNVAVQIGRVPPPAPCIFVLTFIFSGTSSVVT